MVYPTKTRQITKRCAENRNASICLTYRVEKVASLHHDPCEVPQSRTVKDVSTRSHHSLQRCPQTTDLAVEFGLEDHAGQQGTIVRDVREGKDELFSRCQVIPWSSVTLQLVDLLKIDI